MPYLLLAVAIAFEVAGTTALKMSNGFTNPIPSVLTVVGYAAAFYLLSLCLKSFSVGFTYAVWAGFGVVLVAAVGVFVFGEEADWPGIVGMSLIIAGIVVLNVYSKMGGH